MKAGIEAALTVIPYLLADVSKANNGLEWGAQIPLEQTIREMLGAVQDEPARHGRTNT